MLLIHRTFLCGLLTYNAPHIPPNNARVRYVRWFIFMCAIIKTLAGGSRQSKLQDLCLLYLID